MTKIEYYNEERIRKNEDFSNTKSTKVQPVNDYGRIQPQAPELEEAVLGALMIEKDAYSLVSEILRPESFYDLLFMIPGLQT